MALTIKGCVYRIGAKESREYGDKVFYSRDIIIDATRFDPYTGEAGKACFPSFTMQGEERCRELGQLSKGDLVEISFFIDGVKYDKDGEERFWTKLIAYKVEVLKEAAGERESAATPVPKDSAPKPAPPAPQEEVDDLPF